MDSKAIEVNEGLTDPWSHDDSKLILAQGQVNEIIRAIRRLKVMKLPINVDMASQVADAIVDSDLP